MFDGIEWRGFSVMDESKWNLRKAKNAERQQQHEERVDIYMLLEDDQVNLKLRWGQNLELKKRVAADKDGVERWRRHGSIPLRLETDIESVRDKLLSHKGEL
jgi:hypothetical protein